jgi:hypothetical protein
MSARREARDARRKTKMRDGLQPSRATHTSFFCSSTFLLSPFSHASSSSHSSFSLRSSLIVARSLSRYLTSRASSCCVAASSSWADSRADSVRSSLAERRRWARESSDRAVDWGGTEGGEGFDLARRYQLHTTTAISCFGILSNLGRHEAKDFGFGFGPGPTSARSLPT